MNCGRYKIAKTMSIIGTCPTACPSALISTTMLGITFIVAISLKIKLEIFVIKIKKKQRKVSIAQSVSRTYLSHPMVVAARYIPILIPPISTCMYVEDSARDNQQQNSENYTKKDPSIEVVYMIKLFHIKEI